jgi:gluconolactonase
MPSQKTLAANLQFPEGPVVDKDGSIILVEIERRTITRVKDGTTSILATLDGGPNGLAWGPDGNLYLCNNGGFLFTKAADGGNRVKPGTPEGYAGGWIERIDPKTGERRRLYSRCGEHNLVGPNDLVFDAQGGFYFTDYGKFYPRHRVNGGLYYALADGSKIVEVAYPLITPNGVGLSPDGKTVYVAET